MISHEHTQAFIAVWTEVFAEPAAVRAIRARRPCLETKKKTSVDAPSGAQVGQNRRGTRKTGVARDGPVLIERGEQDRRQGTGIGSGAFSYHPAEARLRRPLCLACAGRRGAGCWGHGSARTIRAADRARGFFPA